MQSIRIGNDISIEWTIKRIGGPESFEGKDVSVKLLDCLDRAKEIRTSIKGNIIHIDFQGKDQDVEGVYSLVLTENDGKPEMATIDQTEAFNLVPYSCMEDGQDSCTNLKVTKVKLESSFIVEHRINVVDNLASSSSADALSANQGRVLADRIMQQGKTIPFKVSQLKNDLNFIDKNYVDDVNIVQNKKILENQKKNELQDTQISDILQELTTFVKSVKGYGLSQNDFNDAFKSKLEQLNNYNDSELRGLVMSIKSSLDTLWSGSASEAIDNFKEIENFLKGITDSESLAKMLSDLRSELVSLIPSSSDFATKQELDSLSTSVSTNTAKNLAQEKKIEELNQSERSQDAKITNLENGKQDNLVSGKNIATINGQDLTKGGNITIEGGEGSSQSGKDGATFTPSLDEAGNLSWSNDQGKPNPKTVNIKGDKGDEGTTFTPSVDAEGNLSWTNDDNKPNPQTVNIKGDAGENGKSAYQLAVENGFKGTESEWLESLKADAEGQIKQHNQSTESHPDIRTKLSELESLLYKDIENIEDVPLNVEKAYYFYSDGVKYNAEDKQCASVKVKEGEKYILATTMRSAVIAAVVYFKNGAYAGYSEDAKGDGTRKDYQYRFIIPGGVTEIGINNAIYPTDFQLFKISSTRAVDIYTKDECDSRFAKISSISPEYGVKWSLTDANDLGQRTFDAIGLNAEIGIGSKNGRSDFDNIYPWSEMKRCNIKENQNGAKVVTFEGESGFSLDGSNGDVMVYIPKFGYKRIVEDGYEERIISRDGTPHPVFIENGKVLDEIFVGAFEGFKSSDGKLRSIANAQPTNNLSPQTFLAAATAKGRGYTLYDYRTVDAIWSLMAVEYGCRNTNRIIGYGLADFWQGVIQFWDGSNLAAINESLSTNKIIVPYMSEMYNLMAVGEQMLICRNSDQRDIVAYRKIVNKIKKDNTTEFTFDGDPIAVDKTCFVGSAPQLTNWCESCPKPLIWHTGRADIPARASGVNTVNPIRYRWIENIVGNVWHYLPDVTFFDLQMYVCDNIDDYEIANHDKIKYLPRGGILTAQKDNGHKGDVKNANYWIKTLAHDVFSKGISFGQDFDKSLTSDKAFGAYYYLKEGTSITVNGGGFDHLWRCNMLTNRAWGMSDGWYLYGARLLFKNL